jgi:hypothetical protein
MRYIKKFEDIDINIGDIVICTDGTHELEHYGIYEIEDIKHENYFTQYKLSGIKYYWDYNRFRKANPKEIRKYEFDKKMNKYNL